MDYRVADRPNAAFPAPAWPFAESGRYVDIFVFLTMLASGIVLAFLPTYITLTTSSANSSNLLCLHRMRPPPRV